MQLKSVRDVFGSMLDEKMYPILDYLENRGFKTITSAFRPGDPGVHGTIPLRGIDLRCWSKGLGIAEAKIANEMFIYDPNRPEMKCVLPHGEGSNFHIHVQVHPNTEFVSGVRTNSGGDNA